MTKKYRIMASLGGTPDELDVLELPDDATFEEQEEAARETVMDALDFGWYEVTDDD
ncbi:hypothetical protein GPK34_01080 [Secundilactobacillus kimchicus]|nr:hypothetical protein [Secundilactobacillus kimchicus]